MNQSRLKSSHVTGLWAPAVSCSADCVLAHSKERRIDGCYLIWPKGEEEEEGFPRNSEIHKQREAIPTLKT